MEGLEGMQEVIDQTDLLQRCMSDPEFVRQMLGIFREHGPRTLQQLHDAIHAADWPTARRHAHTLKGSSANISAGALRALALEAEKALSSGETSDIQEKLDRLDAAMAICLARIDEILAQQA